MRRINLTDSNVSGFGVTRQQQSLARSGGPRSSRGVEPL
jgi:hypothetical protein